MPFSKNYEGFQDDNSKLNVNGMALLISSRAQQELL